jgi:hypothetical protein
MRYKLNLEAPFLAAAALEQKSPSNDGTASFQQSASGRTDIHLRRPSPRERAMGADYSGETMARYISGLEARLVSHLRKHSPRWHQKETSKILKRWSAPQPKPAPRWAPPIDRQAEAKDYAAALLRERLRSRMHKIGDIRIARTLGGYGQVDPLHLIFHGRSTVFQSRKRQKI